MRFDWLEVIEITKVPNNTLKGASSVTVGSLDCAALQADQSLKSSRDLEWRRKEKCSCRRNGGGEVK